jgi:hypothetical protein
VLPLTLLLSRALAADAVVHDGTDATGTLTRVAEQAGVASATLRAVSLTELVSGRPAAWQGGGALRPCTGPPTTNAVVKRSLDLAAGAVAYMEFGSARAALDTAVADVACLSEPVDTTLAARAWFLTGIVTDAAGDAAGSRAAFLQAHAFQPGLPWDENFAPAARPAFDAAAGEQKAAATVNVALMPPAPAVPLRVDGRVVAPQDGRLPIPAGAHLLQIGDAPVTTYRLDVASSAPGTLVLTPLLDASALSWAGEGERRGALAGMLQGALGTDGNAYVVTDTVLWRLRLSNAAWDVVGAGATPKSAKATKAPAGPFPTGRVLAGSGVALVLAGGAFAGVNYSTAMDVYGEIADAGTTDELATAYQKAGGRYQAGLVVTGAGAALVATGFAVGGVF